MLVAQQSSLIHNVLPTNPETSNRVSITAPPNQFKNEGALSMIHHPSMFKSSFTSQEKIPYWSGQKQTESDVRDQPQTTFQVRSPFVNKKNNSKY
jgi:hypothetical protein